MGRIKVYRKWLPVLSGNEADEGKALDAVTGDPLDVPTTEYIDDAVAALDARITTLEEA